MPSSKTISPSDAANLRHDLRTPINQIVGYCELLLEDAGSDAHKQRRSSLNDALSAVKDALRLIEKALPADTSITPKKIRALYESLHEPQSRIVDSMTALLHEDPSTADSAFVSDVCRIRDAAERLIPTDRRRSEPTMTFPVPAALEVAPTDAPGAAAAAGRSARILVADDIEENRGVLERRLRREGHTVVCVENGQRVIEEIAKTAFDLVLLDVMMPVMDGYATLDLLKSSPATRDIPVIMISALDDIASIVRCIERGADDYLPKPFDPVLLRARISACLDRKELREREKEYLRQVTRVTAAAVAMEHGGYQPGSLSEVSRRSDELGTLARMFDTMAAGIKEREARLKGQIEKLREAIAGATGEAAHSHHSLAPTLPLNEMFAGRYRIESVVGSGGMGMVYRAVDVELGETIAIKTLRPDLLTADEKAIERFRNEIRLARRISHRNIVRTHDLGKADDVYFVTMEYVEGMTLRALLNAQTGIDTEATLAIARQLTDALASAHDEGIIHRDLKPENLLLDSAGTLKIMDFGVARLAKRTTTLTEIGMVVGTPAYMAPEQLLSEEVGTTSDLYSVGVILYECLTGRPPFEAKSPISLIAKVLHETARPPAALKPDIPHHLSDLVMQLLAKEPSGRVATASDLAARL